MTKFLKCKKHMLQLIVQTKQLSSQLALLRLFCKCLTRTKTARAAPVHCHTPTTLSQQTTHNVTKPQSLSTSTITSPGSYQGITKLVSRVRYNGVTFDQMSCCLLILVHVHCSLLGFCKTNHYLIYANRFVMNNVKSYKIKTQGLIIRFKVNLIYLFHTV